MAKKTLDKGSLDVTVYVFIQDSASTVGAGKTGLTFETASLVCYYVRPLGTATVISLVTQTVAGAHSDGGFVEVSSANMPGLYRLDLPDAVCATGVDGAVVMLKGASGMAPVTIEIELKDEIQRGTELPNLGFAMFDSTDHVTPKTGLTVAASRSIDGGTFAACTTASATEIDTASGCYKHTPSATDLAGSVVVLKYTAVGADPRVFTLFPK